MVSDWTSPGQASFLPSQAAVAWTGGLVFKKITIHILATYLQKWARDVSRRQWDGGTGSGEEDNNHMLLSFEMREEKESSRMCVDVNAWQVLIALSAC